MAADYELRIELNLLRSLIAQVNGVSAQWLEQDGLARIQAVRTSPDRPKHGDEQLLAAEQAVIHFAKVYADNWHVGGQAHAVIDAERRRVHAQIDDLERALDTASPGGQGKGGAATRLIEENAWKRWRRSWQDRRSNAGR